MPVIHPHDSSLSNPNAAKRPPVHGGEGFVHAEPRRRGFLAMALGFALMFIAFETVVFGMYHVKVTQILGMKAAADAGAFIPPPPAVTTMVVQPSQWQPSLHAIGSIEAVQGTNVSADLPGIVKEINFESGKTVKKGDILVRLVTEQEQAQLEANEAQRDLAVYNLKRQKDLREKNTNSQSDFDNADANERQMEAMVSNAKAAIDRKTIRAPFSGVLGIRKVNLGQYLNSGDVVVPLQSMDPIYVNFTLPQQNLKDIGVGSTVQARTDATGDQIFAGKITAINALVDEATRNFQAQATLANPDGKLRPGMFTTVEILQATDATVLPVPGSAIKYAPYGDSVFIITKDMVDPKDEKKKKYLGVREQFVKTGQTKGDLVAILSGLKEGEEVVTSGVFKLQNNSPVQINNSVKPEADANPNPEES